jgi:hypothetical protein
MLTCHWVQWETAVPSVFEKGQRIQGYFYSFVLLFVVKTPFKQRGFLVF